MISALLHVTVLNEAHKSAGAFAPRPAEVRDAPEEAAVAQAAAAPCALIPGGCAGLLVFFHARVRMHAIQAPFRRACRRCGWMLEGVPSSRGDAQASAERSRAAGLRTRVRRAAASLAAGVEC